MPLTHLKFTNVASLFGKPHHHSLDKWVCRTITSSTITTIVTNSNTTIPPRPLRSVMCSRGWRRAPCAPFGPPAQDDNVLSRRLGFRGQKIFNSSENTGGVLGGMGPENHSKDDQSMLPLPSHNHDRNHRQKSPLPPSQQQHRQQSTKLLTLPTILTIGRVAAVPLLVCTFHMNSWWGTTATTSIFIAAAITDWLDGYLARKMKLGSAFGAFLDPVADKLMVAATLVLLCTRPPEVALLGQLPWILTVPSIAIIGREITMSAVREWAASQSSKLSEAVAVNNLGKWKTATQMISLTILLATRDSSFTEVGILVASGVALLYVSAGLAVWSLVVYMRKIWKVLLM